MVRLSFRFSMTHQFIVFIEIVCSQETVFAIINANPLNCRARAQSKQNKGYRLRTKVALVVCRFLQGLKPSQCCIKLLVKINPSMFSGVSQINFMGKMK